MAQSGASASSEGNGADPALLGAADALTGPAPRSAGAACAATADCDPPGQCVDGVCCTSACDELCAACDVPGSLGTCSAAPTDEACGVLACAGFDTECRALDQSQLSLNCEAFGACRRQAECAPQPAPEGTPCQGGAGSCDGAGACVVAGKATLGAACSDDASCGEGHCVPSAEGGALICCDSACDGPCQACAPSGHCEATPNTDSRCVAVACPPDDVCRDYTADVTASQCVAFGRCQTGRDCPFVALRPEAECRCDAETGACSLQEGARCATPDECESGVCAADARGSGVCCATACGAGLFCSSDGASCVACEGDAVECDGSTAIQCDSGVRVARECPNGCSPGLGCNALPPLGLPCDAGQCAAPNVCQPDTAGTPRCCARDCAAEGKVCAENGSCVCEPGQTQTGDDCLLQPGDPCTSTAQCQLGATCADGVCCQQACNGACERCEPNTGLCVAVGQGQQDPLCANGRQCTGARGDCRLAVRQPCSGNGAECTTNNCEPTVGGATQICCAQACTGDRPSCRSDGSACVQCETNADCGNGCNTVTGLCNALLPIGTPCGTSSQCASGAQCLLDESSQTRCCERNCAAEGQLCNGAGRCVAPAPATLATAGQPPADLPRTLVGTSSTIARLWAVQNTGASPTSPLTLNGSAEFPATGNCLNAVLQPGGSCSLSITFAPQVPGTRSATITLNGGPGVALSLGLRGEARLANGERCSPERPTDCDSNRCTEWLVDADGDGFGAREGVNGFPAAFTCGDGDDGSRPEPFILVGGCRAQDVELPYVASTAGRTDCCDRYFSCDSSGSPLLAPSLAFPGQDAPSVGGLSCGAAPGAGLPNDYDCDGDEEPIETSTGRSAVGLFDAQPCSTATTAAACTAASGRVTGPAGCGLRTVQVCSFSGTTCRAVNGAQITVLCL